MPANLTNHGEEWLWTTDVSGVTGLTFGVYNDATDAITDTAEMGSITSEPGGSSYSRLDASISVFRDASSNWGFRNGSQEAFSLGDASTGSVTAYFYAASFQASGQASATLNPVVVGSLSKTYDLNSVDTLNINAESAGVTVD